jgi:glutathione S-transferase
MITFFYSTGTCSTAAHIALEEAGLPFEGVEVSWQRDVNVEKLNAVNPLGSVPALVIDGAPLTQNAAILEYVAEAAPAKNLLAKPGTMERLETLSWVAFATADLQKAVGPFFALKRAEIDDKAKAALRQVFLSRFEKYVAHANRHLAGRELLVGNRFTIADAALFTILGWAKWIEFPLAPYENVTAYMKRVYARPAVQKVLKAEGMLDYLPA